MESNQKKVWTKIVCRKKGDNNMDKTTVLNRLNDILQGGELNTLAEASLDYGLPVNQDIEAQSFLKGVVIAAQEFAGVTREEINGLKVRMEVSPTLSNWDLIHQDLS